MIDLTIVLLYFIVIIVVAWREKLKADTTADEYFLSNRSLPWYSVALSTIATNVEGYQFLGMMGSAYLFGLAQASLEINAMQGLLLGAFVFAPLFLKERITTITEFIEKRLGRKIALVYSLSNIGLFSTITLGAALFWGAYAADVVFAEQLDFLSHDRITRIAILIVVLGVFSAAYTYMGGFSAVVKTDLIQFGILFFGGLALCWVVVNLNGGWGALYEKTPERMHLHLPADHPTLPWTHMFGLFLLNINYWCGNQAIMQRAIAAKSVGHAQAGLLAGGLMKYLLAVIIIVPGIALFGLVGNSLPEPDMAFPYIVKTFLPEGIKGIILCSLFASVMSTLDSTYNSIGTLWSHDIYSRYINPNPSDRQRIEAGKRAIIVSLFTSLVFGLILLYLKFESPDSAFTHTLNNLRYYIICGVVVLVCVAAFMIAPSQKVVIVAAGLTFPLNLVMQFLLPDMNYFVRAGWVIMAGLVLVLLLGGGRIHPFSQLGQPASRKLGMIGWLSLGSLLLLHVIFH